MVGGGHPARSRYSASPPTRGQIDILLSLRMTSSFFFSPLAWLNASKTMPEGRAPSPMTATRMSIGLAGQLVADLEPQGGRGAQPACPVMNRSKGLSDGLG